MVTRAVQLDFTTKAHGPVESGAIEEAIRAGRYVWIDIEAATAEELSTALNALGRLDPEVVEHVVEQEETTQIARYEGCLHLAMCAGRFDGDDFSLQRFDAVLGEGFLLTARVGACGVLDRIRKEYAADFVRHANTPSFLVFELWDHLADHYVEVQKRLEKEVEQLQRELFKDSDDDVFERVSDIGANLLRFRSVLMPARAILSELSTRRSIFVSEATQPYLNNLVGTIEHVLQDVLVDRDSLTQALSLYLSMVGHRTNRAMSKLTVISVIFLPLTFLCGVYGMNFQILPELQWKYGYALFWGLVVMIVVVMVAVMRRARLL